MQCIYYSHTYQLHKHIILIGSIYATASSTYVCLTSGQAYAWACVYGYICMCVLRNMFKLAFNTHVRDQVFQWTFDLHEILANSWSTICVHPTLHNGSNTGVGCSRGKDNVPLGELARMEEKTQKRRTKPCWWILFINDDIITMTSQ